MHTELSDGFLEHLEKIIRVSLYKGLMLTHVEPEPREVELFIRDICNNYDRDYLIKIFQSPHRCVSQFFSFRDSYQFLTGLCINPR